MKQPRVFVVQEVLKHNPVTGQSRPVFDLTPAVKFGELVFLLQGDALRFSVGAYAPRVAKALKDYTDNDYILPTGDPSAIAMVGAIAARASGGKIKLLSWDRLTGTYVPVVIDCYA